MWLSKYFVYFVIYSFMGWIYETCWVTIRTGKWDNRGFLFGPLVPIYGVGGVALTALIDQVEVLGYDYRWWQVFIVSFLGSIVLEYSSSYILELLFHARWWDYSYMPLNINGRVCFPYSCAFGFAGLLVTYVIAPWTRELTAWITPILYEAFSLLTMALISIDATLTVSALTDFDENFIAMEELWNMTMELRVQEMNERAKANKENFEEHKEILMSGDRAAIAELLETDKEAVERKLLAGKERLEESKEAFEERMSEERSRFVAENMEKSLGSMGHMRRLALGRVIRFSRPKVDKEQISGILGKVKAKVKERNRKYKR